MLNNMVVGIDVGTTKICTLVGEVRPESVYILGMGVEPSAGMKKGVVNDVQALSAAIGKSLQMAEQSATGFKLNKAYVSVSGSHISSLTSSGVTTIVDPRGVQDEDLDKAMEVARRIAIPHNREVLHEVPRGYKLDDHKEGFRHPIGMHCYRLEVDAHLITASTTNLANLQDAVEALGIEVIQFILNPLAAGDAVLTKHEREMGAVVIDIGGGTTDLAIYIEDTVWHTAIIPVGGNHVTQDITYWMRVPFELAEKVKIQRGHANMDAVDENDVFSVEPFGGEMLQVKRRDLAMVIEARFEEIFDLVDKEIKRSGYAALLRAGAVITGGSSQLPGYRELASKILNMPVRLAHPEKITGMADKLKNPAYSTSVGLMRLGLEMELANQIDPVFDENAGMPISRWTQAAKDFLRSFFPQDDYKDKR